MLVMIGSAVTFGLRLSRPLSLVSTSRRMGFGTLTPHGYWLVVRICWQ